ncbi:hypothetical protein WG66_008084 [Moniliophthora roreri]|uniref:Uncharacterized protein n=1 Tax=Moniliophthora roreri TaxID=221103 RepID=A0A0W0G4S7_MONRR|nr:hypothetical protein WG66_008084 [Moniliophthora roreri]
MAIALAAPQLCLTQKPTDQPNSSYTSKKGEQLNQRQLRRMGFFGRGDSPLSTWRRAHLSLWLVEPRMHYSLDRGLIKIVPTRDVLNAIMKFSQEIRKRHRGKTSNEHIGLDCRKTFPPGNYPYMVVGVLRSSEFSIPCERLVEPPDVPEVTMSQNAELKFKYQRINYPIKVHIARTGKYHSKASYPVKNKEEVLHWQDPWLVTANVREFLFILKARVDNHRRSKAKPGDKWLRWNVRQLVDDPVHFQLLELCLQIYTFWADDKPNTDQNTKSSKAGGSQRTRQTKSRADASSNVAGPSGSGQNEPTAGPVTRSRSKNASSNADAEAATGTGAPLTRARSGKGKSRAGTNAAPSRNKSARSKAKAGASDRGT